MRLWVPPIREGVGLCCPGSACCPSTMPWTICLYHTASPRAIPSRRTAFAISPHSCSAYGEAIQTGGARAGSVQTQTGESQREAAKFKVLIKCLNFNVVNISIFFLYILYFKKIIPLHPKVILCGPKKGSKKSTCLWHMPPYCINYEMQPNLKDVKINEVFYNQWGIVQKRDEHS